MDSNNRCYDFIHDSSYVAEALKCNKDALTQWGLDGKLKINKFRIDGTVRADDSKNILKEFLSCRAVDGLLEISGEVKLPLDIDVVKLETGVRSMDFFDRLTHVESGIVGPTGNIGGCFEESHDGVSTGDLLRDLLVNRDSPRTHLFSEEEKNEFIFRLFRILAVGGTLCQPDHNIHRYLDATKTFYKDLLVIYRASDTGDIVEASQVFDVKNVAGLDLYNSANAAHSSLLVIINHVEKTITSVKMEYQSYW